MDLSSIIGLREELCKREYQTNETRNIKRSKIGIKEERNVAKKISKDVADLEESRLKLLEKSKIYDQLAHGDAPQRETDLVIFNHIENQIFSELVEMKDEFGRTRTVPKEQADDFFIDPITCVNNDSNTLEQSFYDPSKEIRTKGIGFMDLGRDCKTREERLKALKELRTETIDNRQRNEISKEERRLLKEKRLSIISNKLLKQQTPSEERPNP